MESTSLKAELCELTTKSHTKTISVRAKATDLVYPNANCCCSARLFNLWARCPVLPDPLLPAQAEIMFTVMFMGTGSRMGLGLGHGTGPGTGGMATAWAASRRGSLDNEHSARG